MDRLALVYYQLGHHSWRPTTLAKTNTPATLKLRRGASQRGLSADLRGKTPTPSTSSQVHFWAVGQLQCQRSQRVPESPSGIRLPLRRPGPGAGYRSTRRLPKSLDSGRPYHSITIVGQTGNRPHSAPQMVNPAWAIASACTAQRNRHTSSVVARAIPLSKPPS